jgi:hypothetical protein
MEHKQYNSTDQLIKKESKENNSSKKLGSKDNSQKTRTSINQDQLDQPKPDPNVNFTKLLLISASFLGMYIALYSAQNVQSKLFEDDHYDSLGFYSNAFAYLGQGTGSVFCVWFIMKYGAIKTMSRFALLNMPFLLCLLLPATKSLPEYKDKTEDIPWWL